MKSCLRFLPILFMGVFLSGCGTVTQKCVRRNSTPTINGNLSDWPEPTVSEATQKILLRASNNENFLYLSLIVRDPDYVRTIIAGGLQFWFDPDGGDNKTLGVVFPTGLVSLGYKKNEVGPKLGDPDEMGEVLEIMAEDFKSIDVKETVKNWIVEDQRSQGFDARASLQNNTYVCEMKIPIKNGATPFDTMVLGKKHTIGIRLESKVVFPEPKPDADAQTKSNDPNHDAGMSTGMGGRHHGGRGHGQGSMGSSGNGGKHEITLKFKKLKYVSKFKLLTD